MKFFIVLFALLLVGCSSYSTQPHSFVLPSSNKSIDVVLHRSDVRFADCGTVSVLQTFDASGKLIDEATVAGNALHCIVIPTIIEAGGRVGAAAATDPAVTGVATSVTNALTATAAAAASAASSSSSSSSPPIVLNAKDGHGNKGHDKKGHSKEKGKEHGRKPHAE